MRHQDRATGPRPQPVELRHVPEGLVWLVRFLHVSSVVRTRTKDNRLAQLWLWIFVYRDVLTWSLHSNSGRAAACILFRIDRECSFICVRIHRTAKQDAGYHGRLPNENELGNSHGGGTQ